MYTVKSKDEIQKYIDDEHLLPYKFSIDNYNDDVFGTKLTNSQGRTIEQNHHLYIKRKGIGFIIYHFMVKREIVNKIREYV